MMVTPETKVIIASAERNQPVVQSNSTELEKILDRFNIPDLPSLVAKISIAGWGKLSLSEVLGSSREQISEKYLKKPLEFLNRRCEEVVNEKPHGRTRSSNQKMRIRKNFIGMEQSLESNGPAMLLAAISSNEGRTGEWSMHGVTGNKDWQEPAQEEIGFWGWIHEKIQKGINVSEWWKDGTGNILHAFWVMRYRKAYGEVTSGDFDGFLEVIAPLIPEETVIETYIGEITRHFTA